MSKPEDTIGLIPPNIRICPFDRQQCKSAVCDEWCPRNPIRSRLTHWARRVR